MRGAPDVFREALQELGDGEFKHPEAANGVWLARGPFVFWKGRDKGIVRRETRQLE